MKILREVENIFDKYCSHQDKVYVTEDIFNLKLSIVRLFMKNKENPVPSIDLKEQFDLFINNRFGVPTGDQAYFANQFIKWSNEQNGVETNKVQPEEEGLLFEQEDLKSLYYLLSRTRSKKRLGDLEVFLERIAFSLEG